MLNLTLRRCVVSAFVLAVSLNFSVSVFAYISDDVVKSKKDSPETEDLIRRREKVNSYLSSFEEIEKDWLETYHLKLNLHKPQTVNKFDETNSAFTPDETVPKTPFKEYAKTSAIPLPDEDDADKTNTEKYQSIRDEENGVVIEDSDSIKDGEPVLNNKEGIKTSGMFDEPSNKLHIAKCGHDRLYLIRWVTKLLRKLEDSEHGSMCFSFSPELLTNLKEISLSEHFDIVSTDEFVCSLISNATFHDGSYRVNMFPSINNLLFYFCLMGVLIFSLYFLYYFMKNHPYITLTLLISTIFIYCHALKHYKSIIAQKHATMSRTLPSNCETSLTSESGVFDHIKEFIKHSFYHEDCKKYYEAVMIDPSEEISIPVIIADLVASVFFQFLKPLASTLNYFVKEILFDLSFTQKLLLFPLFFFIFLILLLCFKYKINLPFFLGSFEPTAVHVGSRTEDLKLETSDTPTVNVNIFSKENNSRHCICGRLTYNRLCSVENKIENIDSDMEKEEICTTKCNEGKILNFLCDKHDVSENLNTCDQVQINSDKCAESNNSVRDILDICSCKRCTEQIQYTGDKNEDDLKKQN